MCKTCAKHNGTRPPSAKAATAPPVSSEDICSPIDVERELVDVELGKFFEKSACDWAVIIDMPRDAGDIRKLRPEDFFLPATLIPHTCKVVNLESEMEKIGFPPEPTPFLKPFRPGAPISESKNVYLRAWRAYLVNDQAKIFCLPLTEFHCPKCNAFVWVMKGEALMRYSSLLEVRGLLQELATLNITQRFANRNVFCNIREARTKLMDCKEKLKRMEDSRSLFAKREADPYKHRSQRMLPNTCYKQTGHRITKHKISIEVAKKRKRSQPLRAMLSACAKENWQIIYDQGPSVDDFLKYNNEFLKYIRDARHWEDAVAMFERGSDSYITSRNAMVSRFNRNAHLTFSRRIFDRSGASEGPEAEGEVASSTKKTILDIPLAFFRK